jgi:DNA-binding CsgD family transcriptional regulator
VPAEGPVGRQAELRQLDAFLDAARSELRALAVVGAAGIGKTSVWAEGVRRAEGAWTRLSARPAGAEARLSYAALADLLAPVDEAAFEALPVLQRRALDVALLREEAGEGGLDGHAVGAALLSLLAELAADAPLLLAVDDAQWLDAATSAALRFAVRRLESRPVAVLVSVRTTPERERPDTFEQSVPAAQRTEVELGGLGVAALHAILKAELGRSFPRPVLVRIAAAGAGNPFYALEIGRDLERTGVPRPGRPLPVPQEARALARARLGRLPAPTLEALLAAASLVRPTTALVDVDALAPAEEQGVVSVDGDGVVRFEHPLLASAVYDSAPVARRRRAHLRLAEQLSDAEERARHLALGADGPDEATAEALDRATELVAARGAAEAAAELKELAVRMTPRDELAVARRTHELAERLYFAGDPSGARRELEPLSRTLPAGEQRASVLLDLGSVIWAQGGVDEGLELLSRALEEAESQGLRARIHSRISLLADDCDVGLEHAAAALALIDEGEDPLLYSFALHNVARWKLYAGRGADHDAIEHGIRLQRDAAAWEVSAVPAYWARDFDDFETARSRFEELLRVFRERGDEARGCAALAHLAVIEALTGRMDRARGLAAEARELAEQTEQETWIGVALFARGQVCARAGELDEGRAAGEEMLRRLEASPDPTLERMARDVLGVVALASSDLEEADRQLSLADQLDDALHVREPAGERFQADHVEAVLSLGDLDRAERLVVRLEQRAEAIPRPWICAAAARSRALLLSARGDLDGALAALDRALAHHAALEMPLEHGRTLLVLGQLLRRRKERRKARAALQDALALFEQAGAVAWAERARAEIARVPVRRAAADLTPTEDTIAQLAAEGLTNRAIAERIFVSPKTVESNLSRVYRKLGIHSRAELGRAMAERERAVET